MEIVIQDYHIRNFCSEDARDLQKVLGDPAVMRYIEPPFTLAQTAAFLQANGLDTPHRIYALADETDRVMGQVIFPPMRVTPGRSAGSSGGTAGGGESPPP